MTKNDKEYMREYMRKYRKKQAIIGKDGSLQKPKVKKVKKVSKKTSRLLSYIAQVLEIDGYWDMSVEALKVEIAIEVAKF